LFHLSYDVFFILFIVEILQNGAGSKSRVPPLASEPLGFGQRHDATVDIPLDTSNVMSLLMQGFS
jgi:hypothetical protein